MHDDTIENIQPETNKVKRKRIDRNNRQTTMRMDGAEFELFKASFGKIEYRSLSYSKLARIGLSIDVRITR